MEQAARIRHTDTTGPQSRSIAIGKGSHRPNSAAGDPNPTPMQATPMAVGKAQALPGPRLRLSAPARRDLWPVTRDPGPGLRTTGHRSGIGEILIRLLDLAGSLGLLILALPVIMVSALLIKITSAGPVFYQQERVGQGGRLFTLYKFRTMINDAEKHLGPVLATKDDERVTPVGRVLRRMRIDELPQIYNVVRGDMSLVGPRPERPFFVARHEALQGVRLAVKPGLTGLAQIRSFYDLKPAHKLKYDHLYIQKRSFWLNIYILLQTIPVLFAKKGW
jgi:lipopolysaccharide/colanic/teichoic acid biosynthesis glycosyltransferase